MACFTLGIESSCDETAAAVVADGVRVRANVVSSQAELHAPFGGVVPEVASRDHVKRIVPVVRAALAEAGLSPARLNLIGATAGPGLIGPLLVGLSFAEGLAFALGKPFVAVNHLEGHLFALRLSAAAATPPLLALLVSGGHTALIHVRAWGRYEVLGTTRDDAAGEAFDKVGKLLGLPYPAGPQIDRLAREGDPAAVPFPRPLLEGDDFSFSGLKTAVRYFLEQRPRARREDVAASFQAAVVEVLVEKLFRAARRRRVRTLAVVGGVAANSALRAALAARGEREGRAIFYPEPELCLDNGAMIAACAHFHHVERGRTSPLRLSAQPSLPLGAALP